MRGIFIALLMAPFIFFWTAEVRARADNPEGCEDHLAGDPKGGTGMKGRANKATLNARMSRGKPRAAHNVNSSRQKKRAARFQQPKRDRE